MFQNRSQRQRTNQDQKQDRLRCERLVTAARSQRSGIDGGDGLHDIRQSVRFVPE